MEKVKIYIHQRSEILRGFGRFTAETGDGDVVASHSCSSIDFAKSDLGLTGTGKHSIYNDRFGVDGWELIWVPAQAAKEATQ